MTSSSSSSFATTTVYKSIQISTPSDPSESTHLDISSTGGNTTTITTSNNNNTTIITLLKKTRPILLLLLALAVSVVGLVSHAHRSFTFSSSLSPIIISSQSLMTSSIDDLQDKDFFVEDPVVSFPDVDVIAQSFPVSSSSLSVIASQSLMTKTNDDVVGVVGSPPGDVRVGGPRHCCYFAHALNGGDHGSDYVNCEVYAINWHSNGCRARPAYATSHPNDPCVFSPGIDCCPKSNFDHSIAYAFGGCIPGH